MKKTYLFLLLLISLQTFSQSPEKILTYLDKPYYVAGQEINFQIEILDGQMMKSSKISTPLYVEWIDLKNGKLLNRWILKLKEGKTSLTFRTSDKLSSSYYQIRTYTNWMRNFYVPTQNVLVLGINYEQEITQTKVDTLISYYQQNANLVASLSNRIAILVKNTFGEPIETTALLTNTKKDSLLSFRTDKQGVGIVSFTPILGETYIVALGSKNYELPKISENGSILLSDASKNVVKILIQNKPDSSTNDSLMLVVHQRGKIVNSFRVSTAKPSVLLHLEKTALSAGLLNIWLLDRKKQLLAQQMVFVDSTNADTRTKAWLLDTEVGEKLENLSTILVNRQLHTLTNQLFLPASTISNKEVFEPENGLRLTGKVELNKVDAQNVSLSLVLENFEDKKNAHSQLKITDVMPNGHFAFTDLDYYNDEKATLMATYKKEHLPVSLDSLTIPPIQAQNKPINWKPFMTNKADIEKIRYATFEEIKKLNEQKIIALNEVTIKANKKVETQNPLFMGNPTISVDGTKIPNGTQSLDLFYAQFIKNRLDKSIRSIAVEPRAKAYLDGNVIGYGTFLEVFGCLIDPMASYSPICSITPSEIEKIDIYDGSASYAYNADFVIHIHTKSITKKKDTLNVNLVKGYYSP